MTSYKDQLLTNQTSDKIQEAVQTWGTESFKPAPPKRIFCAGTDVMKQYQVIKQERENKK